MKIEYDMTNNYWNCHNEAQAIVMMKKKLKKNPKKKVKSLFSTSIFYMISIIVLFIVMLILKQIGVEKLFISVLSDLLIFLVILLLLYYFIILITYYINKRKSSHKGVLLIKDDGLTDTSEKGVVTDIPWEQISFVAIKKYTVTFVTTISLVVFVNVEKKKEILKAIKKYRKDLLVIDQSENS